MADFTGIVIEGNQIVIFIVPRQCPRTDAVARTISAVLLLNARTGREIQHPVEIAKRNLDIVGYGRMQRINIVINLLIKRFHTFGNIHLTLERMRFMVTGEVLDFADELVGFFLGDKAGALDCIHEQLELGQFKLARRDVIAAAGTSLTNYIQTKILECFDIRINAFALSGNAAALERRTQFICGEFMVLIRSLQQDLV